MAYSNFTLEDIEKKLGLDIKLVPNLFANVEPQEISQILQETLKLNVPLAQAIHTEKARSELIVAQILVELKRHFAETISLFSGVDLNVDFEKGLNGVCDFLISQSDQQLLVEAPIIALVEAKNDNLKNGLPQCIAEMFASRLFNENRRNSIKTIFGVVTTGTLWSFLKLEEQIVFVDASEYYIESPEKIFGVLSFMAHYNLNRN